MSLFDINNNGVNDWTWAYDFVQEGARAVFTPFYSVNKASEFIGGSGNVFEDLGAGVGYAAGNVGEGLFKGLTSNTGGLLLLGGLFLLAKSKI